MKVSEFFVELCNKNVCMAETSFRRILHSNFIFACAGLYLETDAAVENNFQKNIIWVAISSYLVVLLSFLDN
jgi:hypothetical protein